MLTPFLRTEREKEERKKRFSEEHKRQNEGERGEEEDEGIDQQNMLRKINYNKKL